MTMVGGRVTRADHGPGYGTGDIGGDSRCARRLSTRMDEEVR
jgi:hypothetical protein